MAAVEWNGYELIPHPAYSPDLAPSNFFLLPNLKKDIHGLHFRSDEEIVMAVEEWVNQGSGDFEIWIGPADDDDIINEPISKKKKYVYIPCHKN